MDIDEQAALVCKLRKVYCGMPHANSKAYEMLQESGIFEICSLEELLQVFEDAQTAVKEVLGVGMAPDNAEPGIFEKKKRRAKGLLAASTGRRSAAAKTIMKKHCKAFGGALNDLECIVLIGCSRNSFYKWKRELKEESLDWDRPAADQISLFDE